ncbi:MAG: adenine deaminase [Chloroflexi bacterium]|nr:adenine deaminase [Chloroflexota bacterium]
MGLKRLIAVARGDLPADLVLANAKIVNTFTGEIEVGNVAISEGKIAGIGDYLRGRMVTDLKGAYLAPGLIDGHFHLESSNMVVGEYARAVVPRGVLGGVTDLHEIANVCGVEGIKRLIRQSRQLPYDMFVLAPSCVPATAMETSGVAMGPREIRRALRLKGVIGLGEFMDFPSVIRGDDGALDKLSCAGAGVKEGHAPGLAGRQLNAYLAPLIGSDHETTRYEEGLEKLRRGMYLMIREGTTEKNLEELLPLVNANTLHRCMLVVDDQSAGDIMREGDLDAVVKKAIRLGLDPVWAIQMATIVPAQYFRLNGLGGIAPGYWANLVVLDDLEDFTAGLVYYRGKLVAQGGKPLFPVATVKATPSSFMGNSFNIKTFHIEDLALRPESGEPWAGGFPVIEVVDGQPATRWRTFHVHARDGIIDADLGRDLLKLVVVERHLGTGNIGKALVKGFGLKTGALATSVAHDSHNVVAVGTSDRDIYAAVKAIEAARGGMVAVAGGQVLAALHLPVAGLLSDRPLAEVAKCQGELEEAARGLGCTVASPFSVLSFLALPVIPELKLSDMGLVDVKAGRLLAA